MSERHEWAENEEQRFGVYLTHPASGAGPYCTTSKEGIGTTLVELRETGELGEQDPVGVLDGFGELGWIASPFAFMVNPRMVRR